MPPLLLPTTEPAAHAGTTSTVAGDRHSGRITITLPWTAPPISLNDRLDRWSHASLVKKARKDVYPLVRQAITYRGPNRLPAGDIAFATVQLHYRPHNNIHRDTDNIIATLKPICDALTEGTSPPTPAKKTTTRPGIVASPRKKTPTPPTKIGVGLLPDDTPRYMAKPEPIIHPFQKGKPGAVWVDIDWEDTYLVRFHAICDVITTQLPHTALIRRIPTLTLDDNTTLPALDALLITNNRYTALTITLPDTPPPPEPTAWHPYTHHTTTATPAGHLNPTQLPPGTGLYDITSTTLTQTKTPTTRPNPKPLPPNLIHHLAHTNTTLTNTLRATRHTHHHFTH